MTRNILHLDIEKEGNPNNKDTNNELVIKYFYKYFGDADGITEVAYQTLEDIFKYYSCEVNREYINILVNYSMNYYKNVEYHNFNHAVNTMYTGSVFMKILYRYKISKYKMSLFVFCCFLHDIGHPGLTRLPTNLDFEHIHIRIIENFLSLHPNLFFCEEDDGKVRSKDDVLSEIQELVFSTNLTMHDRVIKEFKCKYFMFDCNNESVVNIKADKEIKLTELKMLIKLADISAVYKAYEIQQKSSYKLNREIHGKDYKRNKQSLVEDLTFLKRFAIPLIDVFSMVFTEFRFMYDNCRQTLEKIEKEAESEKINLFI